MIKKQIIAMLAPITDEERGILAGGSVDESLYSSGDGVVRQEKLLSDGELIRTRVHTRFAHFPEHTHDYIEAVYMCQGSTTHIINGRRLMLSEGEILFLGGSARHEILPASEGDIAVNFIIRSDFFASTLDMLGAEKAHIRASLLQTLFGGQNNGYLHFEVAGILPVQNLIENLIWTLTGKEQNAQSINQATMALLLMQIMNYSERLIKNEQWDKTITDVLDYIENNYKDGSLLELSSLLHYDFYWLSREIKARTGKTYTEHLQKKRLSEAAGLLKATSLSVEAVALAVGYENKSYFHRLFSKRFGTSPYKYRRKWSFRLETAGFSLCAVFKEANHSLYFGKLAFLILLKPCLAIF